MRIHKVLWTSRPIVYKVPPWPSMRHGPWFVEWTDWNQGRRARGGFPSWERAYRFADYIARRK